MNERQERKVVVIYFFVACGGESCYGCDSKPLVWLQAYDMMVIVLKEVVTADSVFFFLKKKKWVLGMVCIIPGKQK